MAAQTVGGALSWVVGTRFAFPSYECFFGRLKGLFLRLDLAVAGRCAEGLSRSAARATAPLGAARSVLDEPEHGGRLGWVERRFADARAGL